MSEHESKQKDLLNENCKLHTNSIDLNQLKSTI